MDLTWVLRWLLRCRIRGERARVLAQWAPDLARAFQVQGGEGRLWDYAYREGWFGKRRPISQGKRARMKSSGKPPRISSRRNA